MTMLILCSAPAHADGPAFGKTIFPRGWVAPHGWHVDQSVKRAVTEGDLTGTGLPVRAVLLTNNVTVKLVVFVNYNSSAVKTYNAFEEPAADLKSDEGIGTWHSKEIEIEPGLDLCGSKWVRCSGKRVFLDPPIPSLWLQMGDWGGLVFRWKDFAHGFDWLNVGD